MSADQDQAMDTKPDPEYEEIREQVSLLRDVVSVLYYIVLECTDSSIYVVAVFLLAGSLLAHCEYRSYHEEYSSGKRQNCQGLERNGAGMRVGIHFLHHVGSQ